MIKMVKSTNEELVASKVTFLKKHCMLCKGRSRLRNTEPERGHVQDGLKNLVEFFHVQYNALRREDAETGEINNAIDNKRLCMDLLDECEKCDKDVDLVNRGLNKIRK